MSKKYINNINDKDIAWFNVDNYRYIDSLTDDQIILEFYIRREVYLGESSSKYLDSAYFFPVMAGFERKDLINEFINTVHLGVPSFLNFISKVNFVNDYFEELLKNRLSEELFNSISSVFDSLSDTRSKIGNKIWPASIAEVIGCYELLERKGVAHDNLSEIEVLDIKNSEFKSRDEKVKAMAIKELIDKNLDYMNKSLESISTSFSKVSKSSYLLCNIDLASFSDAELVAHFKKSLIEWRELLDVPEPDRQLSTPTVIDKLKAFKIIPLLDLFIWELEHDVKIKKSILAGLLFHDFENGNAELESGKGKIMRFLNKVMAPNFDFKG